MSQPDFIRQTAGGVRLHVLPTDRFKTYSLSLYTGIPLREETVTSCALTPFVLRRGTQSLPETMQIRRKMEEMYGAGFGFDIYKRGNYQIVQFKMDVVDDRFVPADGSLLKSALQFLGELLLNPVLENGHFRPDYVRTEKHTLEKRIQSVVNDKVRYAAERCTAEMFAGDPFRLNPLGNVEDLAAISPQSLYERYRQWLSEAVFDLYVAGNVAVDEVTEICAQCFPLPSRAGKTYVPQPAARKAGEVRRVEEKMNVSQGKLNIGLNAPSTFGDDSYPAALVYNGVLGAFPHSKLFQNVREKASLAYYASSRYDGHKGMIMIQTGIEPEKYEQSLGIILDQLEQIRAGQISGEEMEQTKTMIASQLREFQDSSFDMIAFDFNSVLSGRPRSLAGLIADISRVDHGAVQRFAQTVNPDTIYFLRSQEEKRDEQGNV